MKKILLSVIIPTRNRANMLKGALESIAKQNLPQRCFETIVVDNGSTDETKEVVDSFLKNIPNFRYFYEETPGLHVGRHKGLKEAKADILVYADDDIEAFPTWLEGIAEAFDDKDVMLVGGKNLPKFEAEPPDWILQMWEKDQAGNRILGYLSILDLGDEIKTINPYYVFGCNFSIRKSVLLEAGGFHPDAMPQELIRYRGDGESHVSRFIIEKGCKTVYHPKASVCHIVPENRISEDYFCRCAYNQGISDSFTQIRNQYLEKNNTKSRRYRFSYYYRRLKKMTAIELCKAVIRKFRNEFFLKLSNSYPDIQKRISDSYKGGRQYHLAMLEKDPELFQYVLYPNYLGCYLEDK